MTKLWDKLWSSSMTTSNGEIPLVAAENNSSSNRVNEIKFNDSQTAATGSLTESIFEKIALMEFESSIYNQLSCSKILLYYYQRIVASEIKSMRMNKPSRTILVTEKRASNGSSGGFDDSYFSSLNAEIDSERLLKLMSKKLSLTICNLSNVVFISSIN